MEIKAKLSLAVNDFKSGLNTAKKELDSFGTSGSKFNSKFAKDIRGSFDNLAPNLKRSRTEIKREFDGIGKDIKSSVKNSLGDAWNPLQQGFSKVTAKINSSSAVVGGFFRNMTRSAADSAKAIDAYTERNARNRIIGAQRAADFENRVAQANRRIDKQRMIEQYGARPAGSATGRTAGATAAPSASYDMKALFSRQGAEAAYSKWMQAEFSKRDSAVRDAAKAEARLAELQKRRLIDVARDIKVNVATSIAANKESLADTIKSAKANADWQIAQLRRVQDYRKTFKPAVQEAKKQDFQTQVQYFDSEGFQKSMASTRYALYDVGQRFIAFGTIVVGALASAVQATAKFESSFTSVERTTGLVLGKSGGAAEKLKAQLLDLSTTIPVSFEQIAQIATLGAQMGIASDSVDNFAETVSKFSAITGISAEQSAQSFGRLGQLLNVNANEFENLSSAITYTGVNSVATDQEILSMSESIAAAGKQAGFSADEVIGMSAALASLKVRPEEARGVLARLFREITTQVSQAGTGLDDFAQVLGVTSKDAAALWKQDPSGFFSKFLEGAQATGKLDETLTALGITNTRELNVIQRLSQNTDLLAQTMADAEKQYILGTYSSEAYGLVVDDLNSKFTIFQSSLQAMSASFGDAMTGGLKIVVDGLTALTKVINALPTGAKQLVAVIAVLAATAAFLFGGLAMGIAGLLAMKLALKGLASEGIQASISMKTFTALLATMVPTSGRAAAAMKMIGLSATTSATGVKALSFSMKSLLISTGIGIAIVAVTAIFDALGQSATSAGSQARAAGDAMLEAGGGAQAFAAALKADQQAIAKGATSLGELTIGYDEVGKSRVAAEQKVLALGKASESVSSAFKSEADTTGELADGYAVVADAAAIYNETIAETDSLTKSITGQMGAQAAAFYIEAFSKYKGPENDQATFWENYLDPENSGVRSVLEAAGFEVGQLVSKGMKEQGGATKYLDEIQVEISSLNKALRQSGSSYDKMTADIRTFGENANWSNEKIIAFQQSVTQSKTGSWQLGGLSAFESLPEWLSNSTAGIDSLSASAAQNEAVIKEMNQALQQMGYSAEVADGLVGGLSEELKGFMDAAFSGEAAANAAADSFQTFVTGISDVSDGLSGARQDTANWVGYMNAAREAAVANGEGFAGSVTRIVTGLAAIAAAGKDTKKPFEDMKAYLQNAANGKGFTELGSVIQKATDPTSLKNLVDQWIANEKAAGRATTEAYKYAVVLQGAMVTDPALLKILLASFSSVSSSAGKAKTAIERMSEALDKLFEKFNRKMDLEAAFDSLGASLAKNKKNFSVFTDDGRANITALQEVISQLAVSADGDKQRMANSLQSLKSAFMEMGIVGGTAINLLNTALKSTGKTGKTTASAVKNAVASITGAFTEALTADTKSSVRLIGEYVSDLQSILNDAFENRYGKQTGLDDIASAWQGIRDSAKSAREAIEDANKSIAGLNVDRNLLDYQLKVAIKYKDTKRETAIRNKIAEVDAKLRDESAKISENFATLSKSLDPKDTSKAAIENRNQVRGMVKTYTDYLATLAKTGMSSDNLKKEAKGLAGEFLTQGQNLGFSKTELEQYTKYFETDFSSVIDGLPRDFTLTVNTDPALRAIETFVQKANAELNKIVVPEAKQQLPLPSTDAIVSYSKQKLVLANSKSSTIAKIDAKESMSLFEQVYGKGYSTGGLIKGAGTGTSDSIPTRLSNGEYVINANAVSRYGVDFMNSLNQMRASGPMPSSVGAGMGSGGSSMVYLSPEDRQLLRAAIDRPVALYTENTKIAASANAGNLLLAQRGSN